MPLAEVYICDKTEGLKGEHLKCGREVGEVYDGGGGIDIFLTVVPSGAMSERKEDIVDVGKRLRFCRRSHANYWLIRQRVALEKEA